MQFSDLSFFQPFLPSSKPKLKKIPEKTHPQETLNYFSNSILGEKVSVSCESIIPDKIYKKNFCSFNNDDAISIADETYDSDIWRNIDYKLKEKTIKSKSFGSFEDLILVKADESTIESSDEPKKLFYVPKPTKEEIKKNLSKNYTSPLVLVKKRKKSLKDNYEKNHTVVKKINILDDPTCLKSSFTKIPEKEIEEVFRNKRCLKSKLSDAIKPLVTINFKNF